MSIYLTIFTIYILLMLGIGYYYSRGIKNTEDYFLSGRRFGAFPIACTLAVSFIGGGMFMGATGLFAKYGIATVIILVATALSFVVLGIFLGPRLRRLNLKTLPQFIAKRFDEKTRTLIATTCLITMLGALAIQFKASGAILNIVFEIPIKDIDIKAAESNWNKDFFEVNIDPSNSRWRELDWNIERYLVNIKA